MKKIFLLALPLLLHSFTGSSQSCNTTALMPDSLQLVADNFISAQTRKGDTLFIGGAFKAIGRPTGTFIGIDKTTEQPINQPRWPKVSGTVNVAIPDGSGGFLIGGNFTSVGDSVRRNLAHINANGQVGIWNVAADSTVLSMAVTGNTVYFGGNFSNVNGTTRNRAAASNYQANTVLPWHPNLNDEVRALALYNNTVWLGGKFTNVGGSPRFKLCGVDAVTGIAIAQVTDLCNGQPASCASYVNALCVGDGKLFIGGSFVNFYNEQPFSIPRVSLMAINAATGIVDSSWICNTNSPVTCLDTFGANLVVGGYFSGINSITRNKLAVVTRSNGTLLPFNTGAYTGDYVTALAHDEQYVYVGGVTAAGLPGINNSNVDLDERFGLAALNRNTGLATSFKPIIAPLFNGKVLSLISMDSRLYIGGDFRFAGGTIRKHVAAIDLTTNQVTAFAPNVYPSASMPTSALNTSFGSISDMLVYNERLYLSGGPANLNNNSANMIKVCELSTQNMLPFSVSGLLQGETSCRTMLLYNDALYCGISSAGSISRLVRVDPVSGAIDNSWINNVSPAMSSARIRAFNNNIYLNVANNTVTQSSKLLKFPVTSPTSTTAVTSFYTSFDDYPVSAAIYDFQPIGNKMILSGRYNYLNATSVPRTGLGSILSNDVPTAWAPQNFNPPGYGLFKATRNINTRNSRIFTIGTFSQQNTGFNPFYYTPLIFDTAYNSLFYPNWKPGINQSWMLLPVTDTRMLIVSSGPALSNSSILYEMAFFDLNGFSDLSTTLTTTATNFCTNQSRTVTAASNFTPVLYQWKKNGIAVTSFVSTASYTFTPQDGDQISCVAKYTGTDTGICIGATMKESNTLVFVQGAVTPALSIAAANPGPICAGTIASYTASTNVTAATYQWKRNGSTIGGDSAHISFAPVDLDAISCTIIVPTLNTCYTADSVSGNTITAIVTPVSTPSVAVTFTPDTLFTGDNATFTAQVSNGGSTPQYQWTVNNINAGGNSNTYTYAPQDNDVVNCTVSYATGCYNPASGMPVTITISPGSPLPLDVLDFNGRRMNGDVALEWKCVKQVSVVDFTIERSVDGINYSTAGNVAGDGHSPSGTYHFTDKRAGMLTSLYYRIKLNYRDGGHSYSKIIALNSAGKGTLRSYPNPVREGLLYIETTGLSNIYQLTIRDLKGKIVLSQKLSPGALNHGVLSVSVKKLASGTYFLHLYSETGEPVYITQFLKQ